MATVVISRLSNLRFVVQVALLASACVDPGDSPSGGTVGHACDTEPIVATSGGDYSGPWAWEPMAGDETGSPIYDVPMAPADDPEDWEYDSASGVYYRSPTGNEMSAYEWTTEHLLVIPNTAAFITPVLTAAGSATVALPVHDYLQSRPQRRLDIASVAVSRQYSHAATPFLETRVTASGVQHNSLRPTLSLYLPTGISWSNLPERVVAIASSSRGGLELHGGTRNERYWMRGPFKDGQQYDLEIAPPVGDHFYVHRTFHDQFLPAERERGNPLGGLAPLVAAKRGITSLTGRPPAGEGQTPTGNCVDGLDNDPDGYADSCDYNCVVHKDFGGDTHDYQAPFEDSKDYAMVGDFDLCASHPAPETFFELTSSEANSILNNLDPPQDYAPDPRSPPFRLTMCACFVWEDATQNDIEACHADEKDCPSGVDYPLGGTGTLAAAKHGAAWEALEAAIASKAQSEIRPVHMVVVVTDGNLNVNGESGLWHDDAPDANGRLVITEATTNPHGPGATMAHEIGHTLGLAHDYAQYDGPYLLGFMAEGGSGPILDWEAPSNYLNTSQGEVWESFVPSKFHPRANGFKWTGCSANDCNTGHPGLTCHSDGECGE